MPDRYTYPNTEILRNKAGVQDPQQADELETELAYYRIIELAAHPLRGDFDLSHLQAIHAFVYRDLWDWAGEIRTTDTGRTNTNLVHCRPEFIPGEAARIFAQLARRNFLRGLALREMADQLADFWGEMTALHPFRDGNTRVQRLLIDWLCRDAGWSIDWAEVNERLSLLKHARLLAHGGLPQRLAAHLKEVLHRHDPEIPRQASVAGLSLDMQIEDIRRAFERRGSSADDS